MPQKIIITLLALSLSAFAVLAGPANVISESQEKWIETYKKQANVPAPEDMLTHSDKEPNLKKGFVSLYNGENLDGWIPLGGHCAFEAKGNTIVGTCVPGSPSTYLSTTKDDYADFIFTAELKWEVDGNTGFMFRGQQKPGGKGGVTVFGPQAEMEHEAKQRGWSGGIYGQSAGGWAYPLWLGAHKKARKAIDYSDWNRLTVEAKGNVVKTWINGIPAAHWINDEYKKGFFSLQVHSGKQGKIHFRNIKVKEL
ncbi:MAG: DUF1080 domain-containing protein [Verrucomicrobiota bacterium]